MLGRVLQVVLAGTLLLAATSGGWLVAGGPVQGAAQAPVTVDNATAAEHGFEPPTVEQVQFNERLSVAGVEKEVNVSAYVTTIVNPETEAAVVTVSLPGWTVAGVSLNPLTYAPLKQAVTNVLPYLPMEVPEVAWQGESTVELGDEEVTAGEYAVEGEAPRLVVARTTMDGDTVFAVGLYSAENAEGRTAIDALLGELTHG